MIMYTGVGGDDSGRVVSSGGHVIAFCYSLDDARMVARALNFLALVEPALTEDDMLGFAERVAGDAARALAPHGLPEPGK